MQKYLGEFETDYGKEMSKEEWALEYVRCYGDHHKSWVLDQVARILNGTPVFCKEARWSDGTTDIRANTGEPSQKYLDWVASCKDGEDGPDTYNYSEGIAP
jgi:hypothetical protein